MRGHLLFKFTPLICAFALFLHPSRGVGAQAEPAPWQKLELSGGAIYERKIGDYSVGSITQWTAPSGDIHQAAEVLRRSIGISAWKTRSIGNAKVFEAVWTPMGRALKVFMKPGSDGTQISVAILRLDYIRPIAVEAEVIQRKIVNEGVGRSAAWKGVQALIHGLPVGGLAYAEEDGSDPLAVPKDLDAFVELMGKLVETSDFDTSVKDIRNYSAALKVELSSERGRRLSHPASTLVGGLLKSFAFGSFTSAIAAQVFAEWEKDKLLDDKKLEDSFTQYIAEMVRHQNQAKKLHAGISALIEQLDKLRDDEGYVKDVVNYFKQRNLVIQYRELPPLQKSFAEGCDKDSGPLMELTEQLTRNASLIESIAKLSVDPRGICGRIEQALNALVSIETRLQNARIRLLTFSEQTLRDSAGRVRLQENDAARKSAEKSKENFNKERESQKKDLSKHLKDMEKVFKKNAEALERVEKNPEKFKEWTCFDAHGCRRVGGNLFKMGRRWSCPTLTPDQVALVCEDIAQGKLTLDQWESDHRARVEARIQELSEPISPIEYDPRLPRMSGPIQDAEFEKQIHEVRDSQAKVKETTDELDRKREKLDQACPKSTEPSPS